MIEITFVHNDDGTAPMMSARLGHVREHLEEWVDMVIDTPIDVFVGCTALPEICFHNSKIAERYGTRAGVVYPYPHNRLISDAFDELAAQGVDMTKVIADHVHRHGKLFLAGVRMSDAHHRYDDTEPAKQLLFPQYTLEHPEYRMVNPDGTLDVTLDYSHEAVRARRLAIMEELARDYPVDGLELDFMRFCSHFPFPATAEQVAIMTAFVREIRAMMDRINAEQRRRERMILGVRLPQTLAECAGVGLDPVTWAREGLIDYLAPTTFSWAEMNIPYDDYLTAVRGTNCRVLGMVQNWTAAAWSEDTRKYFDAYTFGLPEFRALAANAFAAGAHGLHAFNICCSLPLKKELVREAFQVIADRETVFNGPRHYQFFPITPGAFFTSVNHRQTLRFPAESPKAPQVYRFQVADGARGETLTGRLAWRIYGATPADRWAFRLNGEAINADALRSELRTEDPAFPPDAQLPPHVYFEIDLCKAPALRFRNELAISPLSLDAASGEERVMEVVEVWVA